MLIADRNRCVRIRTPWVTWGLIGLCCLVFLTEVSAGDELPRALILRTGDLFEHPGDPVTWLGLLGHALSHADIFHLFGNMLVLWVFGDNVEDALGHRRYVALLVLSAVAGALAMAFTAPPDTLLVGASGAIAGVMGAYLLLYPHARVAVLAFKGVPLQVPASWFVGLWVLVNLLNALGVFGAGDEEGHAVAWLAHIGGFAAGLAMTLFARPADVPLFQEGRAGDGPEGWLWRVAWRAGGEGDWTAETVMKAALFLGLLGAGMLVTG